MGRSTTCLILAVVIAASSLSVQAAGNKRETNAASENAARLGLEWLAKNQGKEGNWGSQDLGLVSVGALAFLSAGNTPETGKYRENVRKALDYILANAKPSGMLNITGDRRDMYNHGLATFVLTQAYGMSSDKRLGRTLRKAVKLIVDVQCKDGGWDYVGARQDKGHDLSLAVMQAKALRGSMDIGIHIPRETISMAIKSVQGYYRTKRGKADDLADKYGWKQEDARYPGRFTYNGGNGTTAMAAAGAVCLQEFGQYGDYRIRRSINGVLDDIKNKMKKTPGRMPFDAYTMYYVAQGLYQVGGDLWQTGYPLIRDAIVETQARKSSQGGAAVEDYGSWSGSRVGGTPGKMFATAVAVFALNIPNRYLPILQEGKHGRTRRRSPRAFYKGEKNDKSDDKKTEPRSAKYAAGSGRTIKLAIKPKLAPASGSELDSKKRKALTK
ncbi:MAG: squalene--hopene cyclase [Phycisphaerales bacterium]|jgi:hypothetical protein|nr:squalene--hopene cyclase [Phycisphaerales bacterium]